LLLQSNNGGGAFGLHPLGIKNGPAPALGRIHGERRGERRRRSAMNVVTLAPPAPLCAQEPIHIPGAIQPHGAFLASGPDRRIAYASANLADFLGMTGAAALGQGLAAVIGPEASDALQAAPAYYHLRRSNGAGLHLRGFRSGPYFCVDIETTPAPEDEVAALTGAQALQARLEGAGTQLELCAWAVTGLKAITGYARVMAYRFDPDGHGEVIAEAREPRLEPYLGLHYPASDIPAQARALFLRQRVGAVADAGYAPVPLLTDPAAAGAPLDLTYSVLRSVSPVHRAYMRNMGTVASLTVSLIAEGELWGMLVCHHGGPRVASPALRAAAAMTGRLVSMMLASLARDAAAARQADGKAALAELAGRLAQGLPLVEALASPWLLGLVGAEGAAIRAGGQFRLAGATPPPDAALQAMAVLQAQAGGGILAASDLALRHPELAACVRYGSGVLLLPLTPGTDDAILFFRPERHRRVTWGGDPAAHVSHDPVTRQLTPRASFAAWEETVSGHAAPWAPEDLAMARRLGELLAGELARRAQRELADLRRHLAVRPRAAGKRPDAGLLAAAPDAMIALDDDGVIVLANPLAARQFGYKLDGLIGRPVSSLLPECAGAGAPEPAGQVFEMTGLRQDGGRFPAEITLGVLPGSTPRLRIAAIRNVSVRKNAERHLVKMEGRYRGMLEASPDVMVMINDQEEILLLNRQAVSQFGYAQHQLTGQSLRRIIREGLADPSGDGTPADAAPRVLERTGRRKDGSEFPVEIIVGPLSGESGNLQTAAIRDITARKQAEAVLLQKVEELNRSNMELEQFAAIASHDLQEPLRIVAGYTQLLSRRYQGRLDADAEKYIAFAVDGATRMQQLIQDMLAYSRVGAKTLAPASTAAGAALEAALSRLHAVIEESRALITYDALPAVLADPRQLTQLFQNLVGNAIKYHGAEPPVVHISAAEAAGGKWRFSVRDFGIGIDPQHSSRIFGMFQRLHSRQEYAGTGIGLAICKKIVESHGGAIWVESAPGAGADFRFTLPAGERSA
jgi:PAS domain S-box-containing protein